MPALALLAALLLAAPAGASSRFAVGLRVIKLVDASRHIRVSHRSEPRTLVTYVRFPVAGPAADVDDGRAAPLPGAHPLIVFAHGYDTTPAPYTRLLRAWAAAGYVVAAPVFPRSSPGAPGGPDEADIVNQPRDLSFVISRLLAGVDGLGGLVDRGRIAAAGQSDGAVTALALGYDPAHRDRRVDAVIGLSGAQIPPFVGFAPGHLPPLLAAQGTRDPLNAPPATYRYFGEAPHPKYLLKLLGAAHLPPYTWQQPYLGIVERVSIAFLDRYLRRVGGASALARLGNVARRATLTADP